MINEKFYLGISLGFNSSACIYSNVRGLLAAISQERLNGEKNTKEIPFTAIAKCIETAGIKEIDSIGISHYEKITEKYFKRYAKIPVYGESWEEYIIDYVERLCYVKNKNITRVNHHEAHALSTFGFYGLPENDDWYAITSDGFGDGLSGMIYDGKSHEVKSAVKLKNSIGLVYQFVTGALGFKEHQHEGKITGLAAYGEPRYFDEFESLYEFSDDGNFIEFDNNVDLTEDELKQVEESNIIDFDDFLKLKKKVYGLVNYLKTSGATGQDIAASVQLFAELITCDWIGRNCEAGFDVYLAGGLFANVKINQRIKDLGIFKNVYVCPAMGDEGTAVGAAIAIAELKSEIGTMSEHVISGTKTDDSDVIKHFNSLCIDTNNYNIFKLDDTIDYISNALANDKIVCLKRGRMEFGPRALCHTSILYNCDSEDTNKWLNDKLSRTEFMPFAPVCREEVADDLFKNLDGGRYSAKFMTMTFDCTNEFIQNYPAACHIDDTARPQIVSYEDDSFMWKVLFEYEKLTGKKALINTSFNLHNNPIIESTWTAIMSWLTSDTDILVIGDVVIEKIKH